MSTLLERLPKRARRGSKPRCHGMTHGNPKDVAARLTELIAPFGSITPNDRWMPEGFEQTTEFEPHKAIRLLGEEHCTKVRNWWFAIFRGDLQKSANFDIASTCIVTVGNERNPGILLVEAKAHEKELRKEQGGKSLGEKSSENARLNHERIGTAIRATNEPFTRATGSAWSLSRDSHYQMSNRFASACKLAELRYPVILVYLGFLNAKEMADAGQLIETPAQWDTLVKLHSQPLFPAAVWNHRWTLHGQPFIPLIRSLDWPLEPGIEP